MTSNTLAEALRSLAAGEKHRSETARLRDVFDEVENALNAGVSRVAVLGALHAQGFSLTLKSFESALYRIRQKRRLAQEAKIAAVASTGPHPATREAIRATAAGKRSPDHSGRHKAAICWMPRSKVQVVENDFYVNGPSTMFLVPAWLYSTKTDEGFVI